MFGNLRTKLQNTWHSKVEEPRKVTIYMAFKGQRTQESYNIYGHSKVEEPRKVIIYIAFKGRRTQESYTIHGIQRSKNAGKLQYTWHSKVEELR